MNVYRYLSTFDWAEYAILYGLAMVPKHVDETINHRQMSCEEAVWLLRTRCLLNTMLAKFMINREDRWDTTSTIIALNNTDNIAAFSIEIDVLGTNIDHMFTLIKLNNKWYIIQSYINLYECIIEPIDVDLLFRTMLRWETYGVVPEEWEHFFHAKIECSNSTNSMISYTTRLVHDNIIDGKNIIDGRISTLVRNRNSHLYNPRYQCLLAN